MEMMAVADFTGASLWRSALANHVPTTVGDGAPRISQAIVGSCLHSFVFADTNLLARHDPDPASFIVTFLAWGTASRRFGADRAAGVTAAGPVAGGRNRIRLRPRSRFRNWY
jgi:hypothetical protein